MPVDKLAQSLKKPNKKKVVNIGTDKKDLDILNTSQKTPSRKSKKKFQYFTQKCS